MFISKCVLCSGIILCHNWGPPETALSLFLESTPHPEALIKQFFKHLNSKVTLDSLQDFMTADCTVESNGSILSQGTLEFIDYLNKMQKKYENVSYSEFLEEPIISANKATFHFQVDCTEKEGNQRMLDVIAIVTFEKGKISHWKEVFCDSKSHPLYPISKPSCEGYLSVSEIHSIFYATYGNPNGIPVVVLHGGPGEGCNNSLTRFFDLNRYYVIMFDQRGSMRSTPFASMEENTPEHSIADIEALRKHLRIGKWLVLGGSWGSTLAILYGQSHPESCNGFVFKGVFLAREEDYLHLLYGMGKFFPEAYEKFLNHLPKEERLDLLLAYHRRIMDPDPEVYMPAARAFIEFDATCVTFTSNPLAVENVIKNDRNVYCVAKHFFHYSMNRFFLKPAQILSDMDKIKHLPAIIIHGQYDVVTPPENAYKLHQKWDNSILWMIPQGGHSSSEPEVASAMAKALDLFANPTKSGVFPADEPD